MAELIKELHLLQWKIQFLHGKLCAKTGGSEYLDYKQLTKVAELIEELIIELKNQ